MLASPTQEKELPTMRQNVYILAIHVTLGGHLPRSQTRFTMRLWSS